MRISSTPIGTGYQNNVNRSTQSQPVAKPIESYSQSVSARTGSNPSAAMKQAEMNIGASLKASQLQSKISTSSNNVVDSATAKRRAVDSATSTTNLQVVGDSQFRQRVAKDLAKFAPGTTVDSKGFVRAATKQTAGHSQGYTLINQLLNSKNKVTIEFTPDNAFTQSGTGATGTPTRPGRGSTATVAYDPDLNITLPTLQKDGTIKDEGIASEIVLAHELVHAAHAQRGTINRSLVNHTFTDGNKRFTENWRFEEFRTTGFAGARQGNEPTENSIRAELGYRARATYLDRSSWQPVNRIQEAAAS